MLNMCTFSCCSSATMLRASIFFSIPLFKYTHLCLVSYCKIFSNKIRWQTQDVIDLAQGLQILIRKNPSIILTSYMSYMKSTHSVKVLNVPYNCLLGCGLSKYSTPLYSTLVVDWPCYMLIRKLDRLGKFTIFVYFCVEANLYGNV